MVAVGGLAVMNVGGSRGNGCGYLCWSDHYKGKKVGLKDICVFFNNCMIFIIKHRDKQEQETPDAHVLGTLED